MLNVALVGLGWWGRTMLPLIAASAKLRVVRAVDSNPAAAVTQLAFSTDYAEALRDPAVHAVALCTPHSLHAGQIVQAAHAKKHVFCEKPLALSRADALRAVEAVNANKVVLAVGHEKRFEPPVREVFRLARAGELGRLLQIEANFSQNKLGALSPGHWRTSSRDAPAGPLTATAIHLLDLSVGIFGPAKRVFASVRQLGSALANGDTLALLVDFGNGHALISAVLATPFDGRFAVYGSEGWAEVRDKAHPEAPEGWVLTKSLRGKKAESLEFAPAAAVLANLEAFADAAAGGSVEPVVN
ncbi:MAG: Gfo/Idh/MocA family protein [Burkholderiales bacterium]